MKTGDSIYISMGGADGGSMVLVAGVQGTVGSVSDKAVQVQALGMKCWLPKKALVPFKASGTLTEEEVKRMFSLARWFKAEGYTAFFLSRACRSN